MKEDQKNKIPDILKQLLSVDRNRLCQWLRLMAGGDYSRAVIDFSWLVMAQPWS